MFLGKLWLGIKNSILAFHFLVGILPNYSNNTFIERSKARKVNTLVLNWKGSFTDTHLSNNWWNPSFHHRRSPIDIHTLTYNCFSIFSLFFIIIPRGYPSNNLTHFSYIYSQYKYHNTISIYFLRLLSTQSSINQLSDNIREIFNDLMSLMSIFTMTSMKTAQSHYVTMGGNDIKQDALICLVPSE